jgi:Flp pilus assembly protein TadD
LDQAIAEYNEAIRLKPDYARAHYNLGVALEKKGDLQAALAQCRIASELDANSSKYRTEYERLLRSAKLQTK